MTVVIKHSRKSRLSAMIDEPGGVSVGVALQRAETNLSARRAESQTIVAERVAELIAQPEPAADPASVADALARAYASASAVIDAASPFELDDLCAAAAGLCDLIDAAPADRPFDWRLVTVHAQAMQVLLALPVEQVAARQAVMQGLREVLVKKLGPDALDPAFPA